MTPVPPPWKHFNKRNDVTKTIDIRLFSCCTCPCCDFFLLYSFHVAPFCVLQSFHLAPFLVVLHVALISCCTFFVLYSSRVTVFPSCTFYMFFSYCTFFSSCTLFLLHLFLHGTLLIFYCIFFHDAPWYFFRVLFFSCCFILHLAASCCNVAVLLSWTIFMLCFFHTTVFSSWAFFVVHFSCRAIFRVLMFSCCILCALFSSCTFVLGSFHVAPFFSLDLQFWPVLFYSFHGVPFRCCFYSHCACFTLHSSMSLSFHVVPFFSRTFFIWYFFHNTLSHGNPPCCSYIMLLSFKASLFHIAIFSCCTFLFLCIFFLLHFFRLYYLLAIASESIYNIVLFWV